MVVCCMCVFVCRSPVLVVALALTVALSIKKTAKGGIAIYIKDNLETVEREELKIKSLEYETVWI